MKYQLNCYTYHRKRGKKLDANTITHWNGLFVCLIVGNYCQVWFVSLVPSWKVIEKTYTKVKDPPDEVIMILAYLDRHDFGGKIIFEI